MEIVFIAVPTDDASCKTLFAAVIKPILCSRLLFAALKEEGLDVKEYNKMLVKIPNSEAIAMLESNNQIKGSILSFSANLKAEKLDNVHMVQDFTDVIQKYSIGTALIANTKFYEENQDICDAVLKVQREVIDTWDENFEENAVLLANQYKCEVDDVKDLLT